MGPLNILWSNTHRHIRKLHGYFCLFVFIYPIYLRERMNSATRWTATPMVAEAHHGSPKNKFLESTHTIYQVVWVGIQKHKTTKTDDQRVRVRALKSNLPVQG